jgi:circadian clock protein KaiB
MHKKKSNPESIKSKLERATRDKSKLFYVLRLFVTGMTPNSQAAIENVRELCETYLKGRYQLDVVDIYQNPHSASKEQIIAAPTLIKKLPLPLRKFVGDMTKTKKILVGLDLKIEEKME